MQQNTFEFPYLKTKACVAAPVLIAARERGNINTPLSLQIGLLMRKLYKIMVFAKSHAIPILKHELIILKLSIIKQSKKITSQNIPTTFCS